jgi:hypothetical protein
MTTTQPHELRREHASATRLVWDIARVIRTRRGWVLTSTTVIRKWRFAIGGRSWVATLGCSFFFDDDGRGPATVFAIRFDTKSAEGADLEATDFFGELRARVGSRYSLGRWTPPSVDLVWVLRKNTNPRIILDELARLAGILRGKRERAARPVKRARALDARLWILADALLEDGRWTIETPSMHLRPPSRQRVYLSGSLAPGPKAYNANTNAAIIGTMLFLSAPPSLHRWQRMFAAAKRRAVARGYEDRDPRTSGSCLMKTQPLSLGRALAEAEFLESELRLLSPTV